MWPTKEIWTVAGASGALVMAGVLLVLPGYREAARHHARLGELDDKASALPELIVRVDTLASRVDAIQAVVDDDLRAVPDSPEVAELIRVLSIPVDGVNIKEQTFATKSWTKAADSETSMRSVPITVDMQATFGTIFDLVRTAEEMDRLVRVSSVRLASASTDSNPPFLSATIGLDAIFDPADGSVGDAP